jgi:hypothetical protein
VRQCSSVQIIYQSRTRSEVAPPFNDFGAVHTPAFAIFARAYARRARPGAC